MEPSKFAEATAYVTFDGHRTGDYGSYIYVTTDYGDSWKSLVNDLPKGQVVRTITEDVKNADVLYLGTETGLWVSTNRGAHWERVKGNLPTVPVYEITLHPRENDMILATHGRAIWVLDDLSPFQEFAKSQQADAFMFPAEPGVQWSLAEDRMREFEGDRRFLGANPAPGTAITWRLKTKADSARLVIRDAGGAVVREYKGDAMKNRLAAGINTVQWDLRVEPLPAPPGGGDAGFFGPSLDGPHVVPGEYRATLVVNGKDAATTPGDRAGRSRDHHQRRRPEDAVRCADRGARAARPSRQGDRGGEADERPAEQLQVGARGLLQGAGQRAGRGGFAQDGHGAGEEEAGPRRATTRSASIMEAFRQNMQFKVGFLLKGPMMSATARPTETQMRQLAELREEIPALVAAGEWSGSETPGGDEAAGGVGGVSGGGEAGAVSVGRASVGQSVRRSDRQTRPTRRLSSWSIRQTRGHGGCIR